MALRKTLKELASHVGGQVVGDGNVVIEKIASIAEAGPGEITFLTNPRYYSYLADCRASAVIVARGGVVEPDRLKTLSLLEAEDPYVAFAKILQLYSPARAVSGAISPQAYIDSSALVGERTTIYPNVSVGPGVRLGARSVLYPGVFLGDDVKVGDDCVLHANVAVEPGCMIGSRVILHSGVVIGSDGFGYAGHGASRIKIPQIGGVIIEDDVEIGANTTIDRATLGQTIVRKGVKIDNLVQIAHNVEIGENSIIAAQVGIAGSTRVGRNVTIAGQAGLTNHLKIGDGATIGPQSGIPKSVPPGAVLSGGLAAAPHHEWLKVMILVPQLPKLWSRVRQLERQVAELLTKLSS